MPYTVPEPKYLRVLNTLRERIETGVYGPGYALPSENQLATEFAVSRPTVLKALGILRQDGWIDSQQGRGHFVRGRPPAGRSAPPYVRDGLDVDEAGAVEILHVGPVLASARVAAALGMAEGTPVYERRLRTMSDAGPVDLLSVFVPVDVAVGTEVSRPDPIDGGILEHVQARKGVRGDYAREWLTLRKPTADEVKILELDRGEWVLAILVAVYQANGEPVLASALVLPGSRHEIEDSYPL